MPDANAGAIAGIVINCVVVLILTGFVLGNSTALGDNYFYMILGCLGLMLCVIPPSVATYINLRGNTYTYENYILQVFLPMCIGFLLFLSILFFDKIKDIDQYYEQFIVYLGSASILSSVLAYTFILYRIKYHGT